MIETIDGLLEEARRKRLWPGWPLNLAPRPHSTLAVSLALLVAGLLSAVPVEAQRGWRRRAPIRKPAEATVRGDFTFCRLQYQSYRTEWLGTGWTTDYPDGDRNLPLRLSQLTKTDIARGPQGDPFHAVVRADEADLYQCPFVFASDVGTVRFTTEEREALRDYLLKGGFLWVDDFWGDYAWQVWEREIGSVLPKHPIQPVPPNHVLFRTLYTVDSIPQIPSIQYWYRSGRLDTSERGAESATPTLHGIFDDGGRLMVVMTHNTDIADGWEREGEDDEFFFLFSPNAYAIGINVILYALTH
ncbi:MAG: DUF4159 domain-containing protein [Gemmatimonadota bacterium]|nr:DUF4159 domain-containing protein [Gemmatimonadota bacterium]